MYPICWREYNGKLLMVLYKLCGKHENTHLWNIKVHKLFQRETLLCPIKMQQIGMGYIFYISNTVTWINNVSNPETFLNATKAGKITTLGDL